MRPLGKNASGYKEKEAPQPLELDKIAVQLLQVMFNGENIDSFDCEGLLQELKAQGYSERLLENVELRLGAVRAYFRGNLDQCIDEIEKSLEQAKSSNLPTWIQKDMLIDLRNMKFHRGTLNRTTEGYDVQEELNAGEEALHYPLLDRLCTNFHEKCIEELFKTKITSPYTICIGSNLNEFGELLAGMFVIAMCHGSLTHILRIYHEMQLFTYYLSCRYSDWTIQRNLLKFTIFNEKEKEVDGLLMSYPNLQIQMDERDASLIMNFMENHTMQYQKQRSHLLGLGVVGYFLSDVDFEKWSGIIFGEIYNCLENEKEWLLVGNLALKSIKKIHYRISQKQLALLATMCISKKNRFWYRELFRFIDNAVDLNQLDTDTAANLIDEICRALEDSPTDNEFSRGELIFVATLRKQNEKLTDRLDAVVKDKYPAFYQDIYLLETSQDEQKDMPKFIDKYLALISRDNETQGKKGYYACRSESNHRIIRNILESPDYDAPADVLDKIIAVASDTFLASSDSICVKTEALELIIYIIQHYNHVVEQNSAVFAKLKSVELSTITYFGNAEFFSNLEADALELAYRLLMSALGVDEYVSCLTLLTKTSMNQATEIRCMALVDEFLQWIDSNKGNSRMVAFLAMYAIAHIHDDLLEIRWHAANIILRLADFKEYTEIANRQIVELIDNDNCYIKNLLQRNIDMHNDVDAATKEYVLMKCHNDNNYIVRYVLDKYVS